MSTTVRELADQIVALQGTKGQAFDREMDRLAAQHPAALFEAAARLAIATMRETGRDLHARADRIRQTGSDDTEN